MSGIDLSIVIPVYNIDEKLLLDSLDSVINNKTNNIEVIIVDDGSRDEVAEICDRYNNIEDGVYVYHQINQGVSVARNKGITEAHGKYIAFVDSDDVIKMPALLEAVNYAYRKELDICFFKYRRDTNFDNKNSWDNLKHDSIYGDYNNMIYNIAIQREPYEGYCLGSPWGKIFKREFLKNNELYFLKSLRKMQDRLFMMYCLECNPVVAFVPVEGYCYVVNSESIVNKYNPQIGEYIKNVFMEIKDFDKKYNVFTDAEIGTICGKLVMEYLSLDTLHKKNNHSLIIKRKEISEYLENVGFNKALYKYHSSEFDRNSRIKLFMIKHKRYLEVMILSKIMQFLRLN